MKHAVLSLVLFAVACQQSETVRRDDPPPAPAPAAAASAPPPVDDIHSSSNPQEVRVEHLTLDLTVDFAKKQLGGKATWRLAEPKNGNRLVLDTRDLTINRVTLEPGGAVAKHTLGNAQPIFGSALEIPIEATTTAVTIEYTTSPAAAALQWLDPPQTAGKKHPFLLSQSQSILARTWVPVQDTPQVRFTYDATLRVPKDLLALMGAENPTTKNATGEYQFRMPQPVPSYLLVLAVGDLAFRSLGPNSGVYAEPPVVDAAAREFADTPKMIAAAEELYGPYRWGRYDMLVLPPSFPFGGMENPRLTFLTPTIIAGDKSLVSLIAHELAHSWSGNLVTNATWNDFWLNEGFTTYFERRIIEKLYGLERAEMARTLGLTELRTDFANYPDKDEHLVLDLAGRDPDEGASQIPYEKGSLFLRLIETSVGREAFDQFLRDYFDRNAFKTMTTEGFLTELRTKLLAGKPELEQKLQIDAWLHQPGLPANAVLPQSQAFAKVEEQAKAFASAGTLPQPENWSPQEWVHFIQQLPPNVGAARLAALDQRFHLTETGNNEILAAWLEKSIDNQYTAANPALERFLTSQGRRKYLKPLYTKLMTTPDGAALAKRIYATARPTYHAVSRDTIDGIVK